MRFATLPALVTGYRDAAMSPATRQEIARQLQLASDALTLAVLTLDGRGGDDRGDKLRRGEQARQFLVEAVGALGRARVYVPKLKTYDLPYLLSVDPRPAMELARLQQIATRLLWQNHAYLPARSEAQPLLPEEERQLAVMVAGVKRGAKIDRALRYRWCGVALGVAAMGMMWGLPLLGALAATSGLSLAVFRLLRDEPEMAASGA
ncbi:MAG: hypothetical protein IPH07_05315 [Deltaproteobacteria bacterium]|nr:hypothetical protein [Deltaproteobacteria bacterium]MBK8237587.1 hypothetical protein [Deltaproteobacteria bacterium]MBK8719543.1 hypothetical protein [Deltaproteobacteria bacterium]MBP7287500.1 hypothetical protein [Nannocystaceae bacterium]